VQECAHQSRALRFTSQMIPMVGGGCPETMLLCSFYCANLMSSFARLALVVAFLVFSPRLIMLGQAPDKTPSTSTTSQTVDRELSDADQLYRAGKFADAETSYRALLNSDPKLMLAQVGLVRAMLRQQKIDEALDAVNSALAAQSNSASLMAAKGDVQFRRGEMSDAELSFLTAKKLDPKEVHSYLGLARVYSSYSLYRTAYGELRIAHDLAPNNIDVQRAWLGMLPSKERLAALQTYLGEPHPDDEEESQRMVEYLEFLKATEDQPVHACRLVSKVEHTETKLETIYAERQRMPGIGLRYGVGMPMGRGLSVKLNDRNVNLLLDTGAGGIIVGREIAEKAGVTRVAALRFGGIGDNGLQSGYTAVADHIRIGELEFKDCLIVVSDNRSVVNGDGLIGANVFANYLIDIDYPDMRLKLSTLPKRPEDAAAPVSLNSEGAEQGNTEQKPDDETEPTPAQQKTSTATAPASSRLPKDRYIAPEMVTWTKVFHFGHAMLVPTYVNNSKAMLFELDTGAFRNTLSLRAAREAGGQVSSDSNMRIHGLNGAVKNVYESKAVLRFGRLQLPNLDTVTFDLSKVSRQTGTEVSGFLGFAMLRLLEIKLDYRDGLVDFEYDPKRVRY
jgi:tetratricopeptide (TPR) repeat protein